MRSGVSCTVSGVEVGQHDGHLLRRELDGIGIEALPQLTQLFGGDGIKFRLTPQVALHLAGKTAQGEGPCKALILQQCGLLRAGGHRHRKARAAQLLLGTQIVHKARQNQVALAAQTVQVGPAQPAPPQRSHHFPRPHRRSARLQTAQWPFWQILLIHCAGSAIKPALPVYLPAASNDTSVRMPPLIENYVSCFNTISCTSA